MARPTSTVQERALAAMMSAARAEEYRAVVAQAEAAHDLPDSDRLRLVQRLRAELRQIRRRDFFPPPERDAAVAVVESLSRGPVTQRAPALPSGGAGAAR